MHDDDKKVESFYKCIETETKVQKNWDFNAKVGKTRFEDTVGRHGLGDINERGQKLMEFCEKEDLFL